MPDIEEFGEMLEAALAELLAAARSHSKGGARQRRQTRRARPRPQEQPAVLMEQTAHVDGIEIVYETIGDPADPALLLIMGLGTQLIHWDRELCERLLRAGST